ncbi:MAG TPA: serine protease [Acidimicrobiales bacterium]|nr:serine protease [Acidimicrobiales bacterium]
MVKRLAGVVFAVVSLMAAATPAKAIIGGSAVSGNPYPFMAAVYVDGGFSCGGTIISSRWVLTAGHCIGAGVYTVHVNNTSRGAGQVLAVDQAIAHPDFESGDFTNDVGLLHLAAATSLPTVRLSSAADDYLEADGAKATLVGWGDKTPTLGLLAPDKLQARQLTVISDNNCFGESASLNAQTTVCTSDLLAGQCNGDSGGPLLGATPNGWVEIGIVSNSITLLCGSVSYLFPSELSEVNASSIRSWISSTAGV